MKKYVSIVISILIITVLLFSLFGCSDNKLQLMGYESLDANEKMFYDQIDDLYQNGGPYVFDENFDLTDSRMEEIIDIYSEDHPEVFWIDERMNLAHDDQYELRVIVDGTELEEMKADLNNKVDSIISSINKNWSDFDKELYIHDYLVDNVEYDHEAYAKHVEKGLYSVGFEITAYGALVQGKATCHGYTRAFQLLCQKAGIQSSIIQGNSVADGNEPHVWNVVKLGDSWYHVDVTNDDTEKVNTHYCARYVCFNVPNKTIERYSTIKPLYGSDEYEAWNNYFIPVCENDDMTYFNAKKIYAVYDGDIDKTIEDLTVHRGFWALKIDDKYDLDTLREKLPDPLIKRINEVYGTNYINTNNARCIYSMR